MRFVKLCAVAILAGRVFAGDPAVYFDGAGTTWDEQCLLETLQGLVNRDGPRLFINFPAWDMSWDRQWVDIYREYNGVAFDSTIDSMDGLLRRFSSSYNGFVVYDPDIDATRYMAVTLSGIENLLPVSPGMLACYSAQFRSTQVWSGIDFSTASTNELSCGWDAVRRDTQWKNISRLLPGRGLLFENVLKTGNSLSDGTTRGIGALSYGPVLLDIGSYPVMAVETEELSGSKWYVQLQTDRGIHYTSPAMETSGVLRWNLADELNISGKVRINDVSLFLEGDGANIIWKSVSFLDEERNAAAIAKPEKALTELLGKEIKHDFRGRFDDSISAYEWAIEYLFPRCNRKFAHTIDGVVDGKTIGSGPWKSMDFAVMKKGFVFNLSFNGEDDVFAFGYNYSADREQALLYRRILTQLDQPAFITGYGDSENDWFSLINEYGHTYVVPQYSNLSFHSAVKPNGPLKQKIHYTPENVEVDKDRYYVCFITSDGDTFKGMVSQMYQSWNTDKRRGDVPITFAVPWCMGELFPAMLEYYYKTATTNDHFASCAVWRLNTTNSGAKQRLYDRIAEGMKSGDFNTLCDVSIDVLPKKEVECLAERTNPLGIAEIVWSGMPYGRQSLLKNGTVWITNPDLLGYAYRAADNGKWDAPMLNSVFKKKTAWEKTKHALIEYIEKTAVQHEPPFTILVFPSVHHDDIQYSICADIADSLDRKKFKVVRLDEAFAAMKKYYER